MEQPMKYLEFRLLRHQILALAIVGLTLAALSVPLFAAEFHLDSRTVSGVWIGEADGVIHVVNLEGKREKFDRNEVIWIDWHAPVPDSLEKQVVRARERFIRDRRKVARKLIRELERAKKPERASLEAMFDGFDEAQSLHAFSDGLESRKSHVREFSFARLSGFQSEAAVVPFVRVYLKTKDSEYAERALRIAREKEPELTRRLFEYVAQSAGFDHRIRAVGVLQKIGHRDSLPSLVRVLHYVDMNIRATFARAKEIREVPINLGGTSQAAQNVTIDLPQLELIEVQTSIRLPVESLRRVESVTVQALESISGKSLGDDVQAWAKYVREGEK
jgi:hypothetical protein